AAGEYLTNGGRGLSVTALGNSLEEARDKANDICGKIYFKGAHWRKDIGWRVLNTGSGVANS
ncbi:MAG TPA: phosphoribosylamine--glycine ligase, partial [Phycisphaeraceae bacterium]|nr:phosphoribosylamine--glycine ligase [Phycisphaeraceae bacterium]